MRAVTICAGAPERSKFRMGNEVKEKSTRAIVAAVQLLGVSEVEFEASVTELRELAKTLGFEVVRTFTQKRDNFDTTAYLGVGKRQEMRRFVENELEHAPDSDSDPGGMRRAAKSGAARAKEAAQSAADPDTRHADIVLVDHEISPSQARNLEIEVGCEVMDRTMVILEIFHRHARSRAARAQVEIARLAYMAPRLREAAKLAGPQGRQRSGTGGRGARGTHTPPPPREPRGPSSPPKKERAAQDAPRQTQRPPRPPPDQPAPPPPARLP